MNLEEMNKILLKDPAYRKEYFIPHIGMEVQFYRKMRGLTQKELAKRIGTTQSGIARLENDESLPSLSFLHKVMRELGYVVKIKFVDEKEYESS